MANNEKHIDLIMRLVDHVTRPIVEIRSHMQRTERQMTRLGSAVKM